MKHTLLLLLSTILLLFTLAQPQKPVNGVACALKSELKAANLPTKLKRPCAKKCLKHQTHSEQKDSANVVIDCSQQLYAVVADKESDAYLKSAARQQLMATVQQIHPAPSLGADPDPPRFS
ncbi:MULTISPECIES: hypothetical protein [Pontibacter]|uniref:Uncharacterized protein n=1 Tax=Pontibacter lucknowensis TaxID=1077936 RepID=A0A1N6XI76_9BACT|nr:MULTISPECIES: hypothetical protein [Pontibacter]EJF11478.1 hypothetical protein O71_02822 [Pontibacter sp. BAB1700]SIR02034.1 hypothetical protein SAMN05421545_2157 [Pontibacter lucknowensis]